MSKELMIGALRQGKTGEQILEILDILHDEYSEESEVSVEE
jgi:hypothetical protein